MRRRQCAAALFSAESAAHLGRDGPLSATSLATQRLCRPSPRSSTRGHTSPRRTTPESSAHFSGELAYPGGIWPAVSVGPFIDGAGQLLQQLRGHRQQILERRLWRGAPPAEPL